MTTLLCSSPCCTLPGIHQAEPGDGHDDTCRGCQPARAADGLYLCQRCAGLLERDPFEAAQLHAALGMVLAGGSSTGERGPGGKSTGVELHPVAVEARAAIRSVLAGLCRLVAEERGIGLPDDTVIDMARYLNRHARWLAAHRAAGEHAGELRDVVTDGRTKRVAYAVSSDRTLIGLCNQPRESPDGDVGACGARLWSRPAPDGETGEEVIACPECGASGTVRWWRWELCAGAEEDEVVDVYAAAAFLSWRWGRPVEVWMLRQWGRRAPEEAGLVCTVLERNAAGRAVRWLTETDDRGRVRFELGPLERYAATRWGEAPDTLARGVLTA